MPESEIINQELSIDSRIRSQNIEGAKNFEEYWIASVGETLYNKFVNKYTKKMWLVDQNSEIDTFSWSPKGVALKEGNAAAWEGSYSGYPYAADGYNFTLSLVLDVKVFDHDVTKDIQKKYLLWTMKRLFLI